MFDKAMKAVEVVDLANDQVRRAQADLREAKQDLIEEVLREAPVDQLIHMGVLSVNLGTIRRFNRMSQR